MRFSVRYEEKIQTIELNDEETEQMWVSLSLVGEGLSKSNKERLIQDAFNDKYNKPDYNNWHKFDRHRGMPKKPFRKDDESEDATDHMDYLPDNSHEVARNKKEDYEYYCEIIRSILKPKHSEPFIAVYLDGMTMTEYAEREGVSKSAISHRLATAKKKLKKVFPESSTFPSCHG
ncbi:MULTISPECIES: RNA polymerase sigma factor [Bacillaceae]|uniref:sigma factor-like helix-turn-helix DNA-binding protein n=1 Tax=Bacillaceae TaxID=186817 RepID=UPI000772C1A8|nr:MULTISPECIES: sigma factor-like helix-turn-helix DNA-binding protein [Bacillaceae]KXI97539.1 flagellar biosynthesis protein FliA [Bacillus cereus]MBU8790938.1 sigma-70 family RNA polymerase sigma factor [Oceanobacillus caeni]MCU5244169.1 sigma-70 family RNA polymerase sigma factor [Bacillus pacificus]MCU5416666.1 sigma-70 family RNA polymerase sigma factor [Bacillus pacificus]MCU5465980.1 sigma-70 family RNA polymerase sigma factor [Bacillus pacificus]